MIKEKSIFSTFYTIEQFEDRFLNGESDAVDVIIPVLHTNELWEKNLISIYREIPVNRLLISDGGCIDNTIDILAKFPRVKILDHTQFKSLGFCLRKLIEEVSTDWFVYLHSDVYLPKNWFDDMVKYKSEYDWFETSQKVTILIEYFKDYSKNKRGFGMGGSHLGKKEAFSTILDEIDDDYLYRNEDIIIRRLLQKKGFKWGAISSLFHYHQIMYKESPTARKIQKMSLELEMSKEERIRIYNTQIKGYVKYLDPEPILVEEFHYFLYELIHMKEVKWKEFKNWVKATNSNWIPAMSKSKILIRKFKSQLKTFFRLIFKE